MDRVPSQSRGFAAPSRLRRAFEGSPLDITKITETNTEIDPATGMSPRTMEQISRSKAFFTDRAAPVSAPVKTHKIFFPHDESRIARAITPQIGRTKSTRSRPPSAPIIGPGSKNLKSIARHQSSPSARSHTRTSRHGANSSYTSNSSRRNAGCRSNAVKITSETRSRSASVGDLMDMFDITILGTSLGATNTTVHQSHCFERSTTNMSNSSNEENNSKCSSGKEMNDTPSPMGAAIIRKQASLAGRPVAPAVKSRAASAATAAANVGAPTHRPQTRKVNPFAVGLDSPRTPPRPPSALSSRHSSSFSDHSHHERRRSMHRANSYQEMMPHQRTKPRCIEQTHKSSRIERTKSIDSGESQSSNSSQGHSGEVRIAFDTVRPQERGYQGEGLFQDSSHFADFSALDDLELAHSTPRSYNDNVGVSPSHSLEDSCNMFYDDDDILGGSMGALPDSSSSLIMAKPIATSTLVSRSSRKSNLNGIETNDCNTDKLFKSATLARDFGTLFAKSDGNVQ